MKGIPAQLGGPLTSKPTWSNTSGDLTTAVFFVGLNRSCQPRREWWKRSSGKNCLNSADPQGDRALVKNQAKLAYRGVAALCSTRQMRRLGICDHLRALMRSRRFWAASSYNASSFFDASGLLN